MVHRPGTPPVRHALPVGQARNLQLDGEEPNVRVLPHKARDFRFEKSMGEALRQQNEKFEMQEVRSRAFPR